MDFGISDRTVWIVSPTPEVAREVAVVALDEGARGAVFGPAAQQAVRPLRSRFGLRTLAFPASPAPERRGRHFRSALR
jgi:hypothetical protein